jgi:hypothetical protein
MAATPEALAWLVDSRNRIQTLMLELQSVEHRVSNEQWQMWIGAAFSLWRAVFLVHSEDVSQRQSHAKDFLRRVIERNIILFGDDESTRVWSGGYYINNALFRLGLRDPKPSGRRDDITLQDLWDEAYAELDAALRSLESSDKS